MEITGTALLVCLACLSVTSSAYDPWPYQPQPSPPGYSQRHSRPSKVHRPSKTVYGSASNRPAAGSDIGASHFSAQQAHEEARVSLGAAHFGTQQAHESVRESLGAAHFSAQQAHEQAGASLGAGHFSAQQAHEEAGASLGATHISAQQAHEQTGASLGAAHLSAQEAHESAYDRIAAAHASAHEAHGSAYDRIAAAHSSAREAHEGAQASVTSAHLSAQEAHESAQASVAAAHLSAQEAHAEAQDSLAAAQESVREAHAEAQAAVGDLAVYVSQVKHSLSTSYMLKKTLFTISQHFGPSKVKPPRMIVKDAAARGMVCVPVNSIDASEFVSGGEFSEQREVHSEGHVAAGGTVRETSGEQFEKLVGHEVQKSVQTIGQGQGVVVAVSGVSSASVYGGHRAAASVGSGTSASVSSGAAASTVPGATASVEAGRGPSTSGYVQTSSGRDASASAAGVSTSDPGASASVESSSASVGGGAATAGSALASTKVVSASAGGVLSATGGGHATVSSARGAISSSSSGHRASAATSSGHGASTSTSGSGDRYKATLSGGRVIVSGPASGSGESHVLTSGPHGSAAGAGDGYALTSSSGLGSSSAASISSDGRVTLDVSGPHAEAAAVGAGGSVVRLSGTSGLTAYLDPPGCECVPDYLCDEDGFINTSGAGVINIRSFSLGGGAKKTDARCGGDHVCCRRRGQREPVGWTPLRCGTRSPVRLDRRVVTGEAARLGEFPWMVAVRRRFRTYESVDQRQYLCGGSLIAPNIVLTGAHCVHKFHAQALAVRVGEWDTNGEDPVYPHQDLAVAEVVIHEQFDAGKLWYDVALLRLETPAELAAHVNTICLPGEDGYYINYSDCFATGWGREMFDNAVYPNLLKKVPLSKVDSGQCQSRMRETRLGRWFQLHETFLCAGGLPGVDVCRGDGGSPMVCRDTSPENEDEETFVQIGIVAWGINCHRGGFPGVYADVVKLMPWIRSNLATLTGGTAQIEY